MGLLEERCTYIPGSRLEFINIERKLKPQDYIDGKCSCKEA